MLLEKRRSERPDAFLVVEFKPLNKETEYSLGVTNNISKGGFSFDSQSFALTPGEIVKCRLKHPYSDLYVSANGEIVWKKDDWYNCVTGIKFLDMDEDAKNKIIDLLSIYKNKPLVPSHAKEPGVPIIEKDNEQSLSKMGIGQEEDLLLKGLQRYSKDIHETYSLPLKNKIEPGSVNEETATSDKEENKKAGAARIADIDIEKKHDKQGPPDNIQNNSGKLHAASAVKRKNKNRLNIPVVAVAVILLAAVLYLIRDNFIRKTETITTSLTATIPSEQADSDRTLKSDDGPNADALSSQKLTGPTQLQTALLQEDKMENPDGTAANSTGAGVHENKTVSTSVDIQPGRQATPKDEMENISGTASETGPLSKAENQPVSDAGRVPRDIQANSNAEFDKTKNPVRGKAAIFEESFDNNANNWDTFNTLMASAQIQNGEYLIENKRKTGPHIIFYRDAFPLESDFVTEVSIRTVKSPGNYPYGLVLESSNNSSYGLVFGARDTLNNYTFLIKENGYYSISRYQNGVLLELAGGKIIRPDASNTLKIVKNNRNIRFYINDNYLGEVSNLSFYGGKAGFIVEGKYKIAIDKTRTEIQ